MPTAPKHPVLKQCERGHSFAHIQDELSRCPYCMVETINHLHIKLADSLTELSTLKGVSV